MKSRILPLLVRVVALTYFALFIFLIASLDAVWGPFSARGYLIYGCVTFFLVFFIAGATYISLRARLLYYGLYAACLTVSYLLPLSPCEPLVNALNRVRPGMTRAAATQTMRGFSSSTYGSSDTEEYICYKHTTDMRSDCYGDRATVKFVNGRVVETSWVQGD